MFTSDYSDVTQVTGGQETTKTKTHPTSRHGTLPLEAQVLSTVALAMNNTEENSEVSFLGGPTTFPLVKHFALSLSLTSPKDENVGWHESKGVSAPSLLPILPPPPDSASIHCYTSPVLEAAAV